MKSNAGKVSSSPVKGEKDALSDHTPHVTL